MTNKEEALRMALDALEKCDAALAEELAAWDIDPPLHHVLEASNACGPAITAIKEALAQQQDIDWKDQYEKQKRRAEMWVAKYEADIKPLEKAGPVTAQQQEPVAWRYNGKLHEFDPSDWATGPVTPLYTSAQFSKPWVGLTDRERDQFFKYVTMTSLVKAIEAKLKEKNT